LKKKRGAKSQCTTDKYQQQKATVPWLLIYNLPDSVNENGKKVVNMCRQRMQIEENFKDTTDIPHPIIGINCRFLTARSKHMST